MVAKPLHLCLLLAVCLAAAWGLAGCNSAVEQSEPTEEKEKQEQEDKKQRSELAVASRLIAHIDWEGKILTGDAFYCQRCWCSALRRAGGD